MSLSTTSIPTLFSSFVWRPFRTIDCSMEAARISASCLFSLATLEAASNQDKADFALVEQEAPDLWRWAVISPTGAILDNGHEPTAALAKKLAEKSLNLVAAVAS